MRSLWRLDLGLVGVGMSIRWAKAVDWDVAFSAGLRSFSPAPQTALLPGLLLTLFYFLGPPDTPGFRCFFCIESL